MSENSLTVEDYKKLVDYYKNKCTELEYKYLLLQVDVQRIILDQNKKTEEEINKRQESFKESQNTLITSYQSKITQLEAIIEKETDRIKSKNLDGSYSYLKSKKPKTIKKK
jgi:hypothetical protein